MRLQYRLGLSYTVAFIVLLGITFVSIFFITKKNRHEEFHQRFKERTLISFKLIVELKRLPGNVLGQLDKNEMNELRKNAYLFDASGNLIYSSVGNNRPKYADNILRTLQHDSTEVFVHDGDKEIAGFQFREKGALFYGIAQADDKVGKITMRFLAFLLLTSFSISLVIVAGLSYVLSKSITSPITRLTKEIETISSGNLSMRVHGSANDDEVGYLTDKFNEMLNKVENAFKFQHQFINHLSHELKTPLAVMMTNAEVALKEDSIDSYRKCLQFQTSALVEVANIIDTMLDVTKNENQFSTEFSEQIRIDELLFECLEEMSLLHSEASFNFEIDPSIEKSEKLTVTGNSRMLRIAFLNLLKNAINYAGNQYATIEILSRQQHIQVNFINDGPTLADEEKKYLFKYLFRGSNSNNTKGFGLGLMLIHRIFTLHQAHIDYSITADGKNCFSVQLNPIGY